MVTGQENNQAEEKQQAVILEMVAVAKRLGASVGLHHIGASEYLTQNDEVGLPFGNVVVFVFRFGNEIERDKIQKLM